MLSTEAAAIDLPPPPAAAEAQLRELNHRFVDSLGASQYQFATNIRAPASANYRDVEVRLFDDVALVHGIVEVLDSEALLSRSRYTDVYQWSGASWLRVGSQSTRIQATAALAVERGAPKSHPRWAGTDPTGDEVAVLRALNDSYVKAFRDADVVWYEAHLAPDYVVTNPDGSMSDRAAALHAFAQPVFATRMKSFPVDKVSIRLLGKVALIHAENAYELKDGRRGVSHYTDIWYKQNDVWRCIAAHITPQVWPR